MGLLRRANRHVNRFDVSNPLTWPFLFATFAYGVGFLLFPESDAVGNTSLFMSMTDNYEHAHVVWGAVAVATTILGVCFLLFHTPNFGKFSGLAGFMLWVFAGFSWFQSDGYVSLLAVALPNAWFWFWQYIYLMRLAKNPDMC